MEELEQCACSKEAELAAWKEQIKTIFKRIDEQTALAKSVHELASEVRVMNVEMRSMREDVNNLRTDVANIKAEPGENFKNIVRVALSILVGGIVTFALVQLGLK